MDKLPEVRSIQERINQRYDELWWKDDSGKGHPFVCTICDEILFSGNDVHVIDPQKLENARSQFTWEGNLDNSERIPALEEYYNFEGNGEDWLKGMALSPRGRVFRKRSKTGRPGKSGFTCCEECKKHAEKKQVTLNAVINRNYVGGAPDCLRSLTEVELAFLTPVYKHGYCFNYRGGKTMKLKGTLVFMRVKERRIAEALAQLDSFGLTKHVLVLASGKMTKQQRKRVQEKATIRTDKLMTALEWLCKNHKKWKDVDLDSLRLQLVDMQPTVVDYSEEVDSENANQEQQELFSCYYPDGATTQSSGGFDEPGAFKKFVEDMQQRNFDIEFKANLEKSFVKESDGDQLIGSSLLQFPYGICGLDERRRKYDGSFVKHVDLWAHMGHLSKLSQVEFQSPMFQLIMHSMLARSRLLKQSRLQLRGSTDATTLATGFQHADLSSAISKRRANNRHGGSYVSRRILDSVDACTRALPHTNEADKKARGTGESLQHYFGTGCIFLTVSFDDDNCLLTQVMSGVQVDDDTDLRSLSDMDLKERSEKRTEIRLKFPGVTAINFEMLLRILTEEVVGWDMAGNCPTETPGYFGRCLAFSLAIEEQGRKSLHGHMTLWIEGYHELLDTVFFSTGRKKVEAERLLEKYYDRVATTGLMQDSQYELKKAFDHNDCTETNWRKRSLPEVVGDQQLRNLRHKCGYKATGGAFATCSQCDKVYTYEDLITKYITNDLPMPVTGTASNGGETEVSHNGCKLTSKVPKTRMEAVIVRYQKDRNASVEDTPVNIINANYQHHKSCHVSSCFRCNKLKKSKKHVCGPLCECRYRLPDRKRKSTRIKTEHEGVDWFQWNGKKKLQPLVQFLPRRSTYDLLQNVSCKAVSESKFACNSNVSLITDGPIGQYQFKYQLKGTQEDDTAEYAEVDASMKKIQGRLHDDDKRESLRLICRAAFAHNKTNVISPPLASYLTRHASRFYFSHQFVYCPLRDIMRIHQNQDVQAYLRVQEDGGSYFENQALNYLCRPNELQNYSLKTFFETYEFCVVSAGKKKVPVLPFEVDTGYFKHPSAKEVGRGARKKIVCGMGVKERSVAVFVKISQYTFPDSAEFHGDILTCATTQINRSMEVYSKAALCLLMPHRRKEDLQVGVGATPYTFKFRDMFIADQQCKQRGETPMMFTNENLRFLQNMQSCGRNSIRYKINQDDLQSETVAWRPKDGDGFEDSYNHEQEETLDDEEVIPYETFLNGLDDSFQQNPNDEDPEYLPGCLHNFALDTIRNKGKKGCGYARDVEVPFRKSGLLRDGKPFLMTNSTPVCLTPSAPVVSPPTEKVKYSVNKIVEVLFKKVQKRTRVSVLKDKQVNLRDATGTVRSVREWSTCVFGKDARQRRAFEAITAAFLLTFYDLPDATEDTETTKQGYSAKYRSAEKALRVLRGNKDDPQMICLMHGPGGSGKSTVINLVQEYAKSYCDTLGHPYTDKTIVVTAMSGVAATILHGETAHTALGLMKQKDFDDETKRLWADARLVIIDEISFANAGDFQKMQKNLHQLMQRGFSRPYGGLNVIFAGDYSQLEPIGCLPVYKVDEIPEFEGMVNTYIELDGKWRFKDDPVWGKRLLRFREGEPTVDDILYINEHCLLGNRPLPPPKGIRHATHLNADRDAINAAVFEDFCSGSRPSDGTVLDSAVMVFMDDLFMSDSAKTMVPVKSNALKAFFYQNCAEDDLRMTNKMEGRLDSVLKLYPYCPLMHTRNTDVPNGQANGSRVTCRHVKLKVGEQAFRLKMDCGTTILGVFAGRVESIVVKHEIDDIFPQIFEVNVVKADFNCEMVFRDEILKARMSGSQFPLISNTCTTGHKLQGCGCDTLLVNNWHYGQNWAYVVLSRVRKMEGLYLREPLTINLNKYSMASEMVTMLDKFKKRHLLKDILDDDYDDLIEATDFVNIDDKSDTSSVNTDN